MRLVSIFSTLFVSTHRNMCSRCGQINTPILEELSKTIVPKLSNDKHKGQAGRIGIVGGSIEYTGAPYYAGISSLKVGADLVHIFCSKLASTVIKSYSPELIVHPVLDEDDAISKIEPWLERLHVIVIGPGLGREPEVFKIVEGIIDICREQNKPLVIDADGLFLVSVNSNIIKDYPGVILTPNEVEYARLFPDDDETVQDVFGRDCLLVKKGKIDEIFDSETLGKCEIIGSGRRCGGQGDLLAGSLAVFYYWATLKGGRRNALAACYAACKLTRLCNAAAFQRLGRSMTTTDMITEIGNVFNDNFELE